MNDYPTPDELEYIRNFDCWKKDPMELMDYIIERWHFAPWGVKKHGRTVKLSTGGWSGNEEIIQALMENGKKDEGERVWFGFWSRGWFSTTRGGHYVFKVPKKVKK